VPILFLSIFPFCFFFSPQSRGQSLRAELAAVAHGGMGDFPAASFQGEQRCACGELPGVRSGTVRLAPPRGDPGGAAPVTATHYPEQAPRSWRQTRPRCVCFFIFSYFSALFSSKPFVFLFKDFLNFFLFQIFVIFSHKVLFL
jgi:hypothetical protein